MKTTVVCISAVLITAALAGLTQAGPGPSAVEHQLKGTFEQVETQEVDFPWMAVDGLGSGRATLLGLYAEHTVFPAVNLNDPSASAAGTATYTAANGDTIITEIDASAGPGGPGVWVVTEHHTIIGGTGRFEGASGEFTVVRQFDDPSHPTFSHGYLTGTIALGKD